MDEGLRIERDEIGLVAVAALVVSGVERAGFFWFEREIAERWPERIFLAGDILIDTRDEIPGQSIGTIIGARKSFH